MRRRVLRARGEENVARHFPRSSREHAKTGGVIRLIRLKVRPTSYRAGLYTADKVCSISSNGIGKGEAPPSFLFSRAHFVQTSVSKRTASLVDSLPTWASLQTGTTRTSGSLPKFSPTPWQHSQRKRATFVSRRLVSLYYNKRSLKKKKIKKKQRKKNFANRSARPIDFFFHVGWFGFTEE